MNKLLRCPKEVDILNQKLLNKKIKSPFTIYADFESILWPEDNGKQNPNKSYTNKYQNHVAYSYGYELVCVNDKFSKPFKFHFFLFNLACYSILYFLWYIWHFLFFF